MDKYIKTVKNRIIIRAICCVVLLPVAVMTFILMLHAEPITGGSPVEDFIGGFFNGVRSALVGGFILFSLIRLIFDCKAIKNEKVLKEQYVLENDERTKVICMKSSNIAFNIIIYLLLIACLIAGLFNTVISVTILITWVFIVLVRIICIGVFEKKM